MDENGWDYGEDDEELMELAMHPPQYRAYKSGEAKAAFEEDLAKRKAEKLGTVSNNVPAPKAAPSNGTPAPGYQPKTLHLDVNGEKFVVSVSYDAAEATAPASAPATETTSASAPVAAVPVSTKAVLAPVEGKFFLTKSSAEKGLKVGDPIAPGQVVGYIESMKVYNAITATEAGTVTEICFADGEDVEEDDAVIRFA
jgi:pyruvate carboxylase subunit B